MAHADWLAHTQVCTGRGMYRPRVRGRRAASLRKLQDSIFAENVLTQELWHRMAIVVSEKRRE